MKIQARLGVTVTVLVVGATLAGCSSNAPEPAASNGEVSGTLTGVWDAAFKSSLEPIVEDFEKEYPGVSVEINYASGDVGGLISTQLQAGTAPDILLSFPGGTPGAGANVNVVTLASQDRLLDLSDSSWAATVPEVWKSSVEYEGKTYAYPGIAQGLGAIYNKTKLDELGLEAPTTISEVYDLCAAAVDAGIYAYAQGLGEALAGPQMLSYAQTGTLVYGPDPDAESKMNDGSLTLAEAGWKEQLEIYKKMSDEGCFGEGALGRSRTQGGDAVAQGQALGIVDVSAVMAPMNTANPDAEYILTAMPATDDGKAYMPALPGYTIAVNGKAKNPEAAKAFLEFLSQPEQIAVHAEGFGALPAIPNDQFTPPENLVDFAQYITDGDITMLPTWPNPEVQPTLNETLQSLLLGSDTVDSAMQKLQDVFDKGQG